MFLKKIYFYIIHYVVHCRWFNKKMTRRQGNHIGFLSKMYKDFPSSKKIISPLYYFSQ